MSNYRTRNNKGRTHKAKRTKASKQSVLKNRFVWDVVLGVVLVLALSHLLFFSRAFEIRDVGIAAPGGLGHLVMQVKSAASEELNKPFLWILNKKSFFSASARAIKQRVLNDHPEIDAMIIKRVFPHGLFLELYDRKEVAVWCYNEANCFLVDKKGVVFKPITAITATSTDSAVPLNTELTLIFDQSESNGFDAIATGELLTDVISEEKLAQILEVQKTFDKDLSIPLQHFLTDTEEMLHAVTKQGWKVYFVLGGDMAESLTRLKLLFEKELTPEKAKNLQYIDLRFSKVYYK